jgi:hypothetical protein
MLNLLFSRSKAHSINEIVSHILLMTINSEEHFKSVSSYDINEPWWVDPPFRLSLMKILYVWRREWKYDEKNVKWAQIIEDIYRMRDKIWIF